MKAMILASGIGKRLMPLTKDKPKCLIEINNHTILGRLLKQIADSGINEIITTTGPFENKIKGFVEDNFPDLKVIYVKNPKFDTTNYIYSMWLTRELIDDDILLMHGDMIFDNYLLKKLLGSKNKTCVLVNNKMKVPEKDFKCRIEEGLIREIGVDVFGENAFFLAPIYKFSKEDFLKWIDRIENFVVSGKVNAYAEDAFNEISDEIDLNPVYYQNEFCMEVDDFEDLETARKNSKEGINFNWKLIFY